MHTITFEENGVDPALPLLYRILINNQLCYIGCAKSAKRPRRAYELNLNRLIHGKPYRRNNPTGFRLVHHKMLDAHQNCHPILIELLRNVPLELRFSEERKEIEKGFKQYGQRLLNTHAFHAP